MNRKWLPFILIVILGLALLLIKTFKKSSDNTKSKDTVSSVNRDRGFDRRVSFLEYSNHANCRMDCRHISKSEVEEIMKEGKINYRKSDLKNARCPRYAVEGITSDNQRVRIVYAQCNEKTEVVTVIDLKTNWECHCPGDDDSYKNRN